MIGSALLHVLAAVLRFILSPLTRLGDVVVDPSIVSAIATVNSWVYTLYNFIPVESIAACIVILIVWEKWWLMYQGVRWAYQKIPFIN
jgi:hypothetical protein